IVLVLLLLLPISLCDLLFVAVIWRHGDRAPGDLPYPLDRNDVSAWPRGWNQLTNKGIKQTYDLGKFLRERYVKESKHINEVFNKDEVLVISSDSERALTSAQSVLTGLFPPKHEMEWKDDFDWQPVPIHSTGVDRDDPLLKPTSIDCPSYETLMDQERAPLFYSLNESNYDLFQQLSKNTGMQITSANVDNLYDITREIDHGMKQPKWVTKDLIEKIKEFKRAVRTNEFDTQPKARFRGGYLLGDWLRRINAVANESEEAMKTILYSSHDGTLSALLGTMGVSNNQLVPYAAAIMAELHRENGQDFVQMGYRNETSSKHGTPYQLTLPGCAFSCPLSTFNTIIAPLTVNSMQQLEEMCNSTSPLHA
ncbi:hypothetical protein PENTCL1PPCAC_19597, partial [Pristionchus entomophagus]